MNREAELPGAVEAKRAEREKPDWCVGHGDELEGERPLWGLREATTSQRQLHEPRGRVGRKPEDEPKS